MNLASVHEGDIVLVNDGLPFHALVEEKEARRLRVRPLCGHFNPRPIKATDVHDHWRRSRAGKA